MGVVALRTEEGVTPLVGEYDALRAHLVALAAGGRLTADGLLSSGRMPDGRCYARVRLRTVAPRRRVRRSLVIAGGVAAAAVVAGAVWVVVVVVAWVLAHLVQIVAAIVVLALLALWALSAGGGKHCPGCQG